METTEIGLEYQSKRTPRKREPQNLGKRMEEETINSFIIQRFTAEFQFNHIRPISQTTSVRFYGGAGCQCRSSRVCPAFVLYPEFVLHMSSLCLDNVLVHCMSSLCLQYPTYVLVRSSVCPAGPTYVLNLSSDFDQIYRKIGEQNLDK